MYRSGEFEKKLTSHYDERNTRFVARIRNHRGYEKQKHTKTNSPPIKRKRFNDNEHYSCISNPKNNAVYLSDSTYSGKFLNNQSMSKDDL